MRLLVFIQSDAAHASFPQLLSICFTQQHMLPFCLSPWNPGIALGTEQALNRQCVVAPSPAHHASCPGARTGTGLPRAVSAIQIPAGGLSLSSAFQAQTKLPSPSSHPLCPSGLQALLCFHPKASSLHRFGGPLPAQGPRGFEAPLSDPVTSRRPSEVLRLPSVDLARTPEHSRTGYLCYHWPAASHTCDICCSRPTALHTCDTCCSNSITHL